MVQAQKRVPFFSRVTEQLRIFHDPDFCAARKRAYIPEVSFVVSLVAHWIQLSPLILIIWVFLQMG